MSEKDDVLILDAISGTTPPYSVCMAIWVLITFDNTSLPFFTTAELDKALKDFAQRNRRFGGV